MIFSRDKAHKVFVEAIKCNYDNWKVWENFLWVCLIEMSRDKCENFFVLKTSADCGETEDVIQAYHRLIDLKTKYIDKEVDRLFFQNIIYLCKEILGITTISSFIIRK
jgi:hypothetical protein